MTSSTRKTLSAIALVAAGVVGGGVLTSTLTATAAESPAPPPHAGDRGGPRAGETTLTGDTLAKVTAAVLKKYPGATVVRAETDSDGVYEAHITKADGTCVTVELDKGFAVTGEEQRPGGPGGGPGGHGPRGHRGPAPAPSSSPKAG